MRVLLALLLAVFLCGPALALDPGEALADPALEARARAISAELRCLVCQNQSIDLSDADLARELRQIVRERLVSGDSDEAVKQYLVARYGEFVLLRPVFAWHTAVLWVAAPVLLAAGAVVLILGLRRRSVSIPASGDSHLSDEESAALENLRRPGN